MKPAPSQSNSPTAHRAAVVPPELPQRWLSATPYLLASCFPLSMWLANLSEEPATWDVAMTLAVALGTTLALQAVIRPLIAGRDARTLVLCVAIIGVLAYGHVHQFVTPWGYWHRHLIPVWTFMCGALTVAILWSGEAKRAALVGVVRLSAIAWIGIQVAPALPVGWSHWRSAATAHASDPVVAASDPRLPADRPDIYYIILDAYARGDVLAELCEFDNRPFLEELRTRGFYVAEQARSNYAQTRLSLPSSLNMDYLRGLDPADSYAVAHARLRQLRKQSRVVGRLRSLGYRYRFVGSNHFRRDESADEELYFGDQSHDYLRAFLATTMLALPNRALDIWSPQSNPADVHLFQFEQIAAPKSDSAPLLTYAHVCCPHAPYVFDRSGPTGRVIDEHEAQPGDYVEQLQFVNAQVLKLIDRIDRTSGRAAVILLQADHGSDLLGISSEPSPAQLHERMSIFAAYRCPPNVTDRLYPSITPVNSFRAVLGGLFGDPLPRLEDHSYYSSYERPFHFIEYSCEQVKLSSQGCTAP